MQKTEIDPLAVNDAMELLNVHMQTNCKKLSTYAWHILSDARYYLKCEMDNYFNPKDSNN